MILCTVLQSNSLPIIRGNYYHEAGCVFLLYSYGYILCIYLHLSINSIALCMILTFISMFYSKYSMPCFHSHYALEVYLLLHSVPLQEECLISRHYECFQFFTACSYILNHS